MSFPALGTTHDGTDDKEHDINQVMFAIDLRRSFFDKGRCSINVIARASCMETRLDHRRSACSNFINKVRSRPDQETTIGELAQKSSRSCGCANF